MLRTVEGAIIKRRAGRSVQVFERLSLMRARK
jgi:hypothetical protein